MRLVVRSERVVLADGVRPASVHVDNGRIAAIAARHASAPGVREIDAGDLMVLPGLVDTHVHINDPGRADWEGFEHATKAAAAGGVTTVVDMPLNSVPPTTSVEGFDAKRAAARGRCYVDVGFWGGVVPGNASALEPLARRGVLGFKCFLSPSGVDEFPHVSEDDLREALPILAKLKLPLLAHAELPARLRDAGPDADCRKHRTWLETRPPDSEQAAIELLIRLSRATGAAVHIVHLASADAVPALIDARAAGVPVTVETCPHYLTFAADDIADGATAFKCAPPIRQRDHRERLWTAIAADHIDLVATDHSPAPPSLKRLDDGDFLRAWGGIASLQLGLSATWSGAVARGISIGRVVRLMAAAPAILAGLHPDKGTIAVGASADLAIWDPDAEIVVEPATLHHRHPVTPYAGMRLRGRVRTTLLRGDVIFDEGRLVGPPRGRELLGRNPSVKIAAR
jgi:allantoinase